MSIRDIAGNRDTLEAGCRVAARTVPIREGVNLARILGGVPIVLDMHAGISAHLALDGYWESWITVAVAKMVREGMVCVDVGANRGYYTLLFASLVGPGGLVFSVEPNFRLLPNLRQSLDLNGFAGRVSVCPVALTDREGEIDLVTPGGNDLNASVVIRDGDKITVPMTTLDALTADGPPVDFVKVDAEGAEWMIWRGMLDTLGRNPAINVLLEFNAGRYDDPAAFIAEIVAEGFTLACVDGRGCVVPVAAEQLRDKSRVDDWMLWLYR